MSSHVNITQMDAFTYRERLAAGDVVMLIPVGSIEQHGPHAPLGVDMMLSTKISELVADRPAGRRQHAQGGDPPA